jgi:alpha-tubulin suppressor-like RCC1 family protein
VVKINTEEVYIVNAKCSGAATILMSNEGNLYACGENNDNRSYKARSQSYDFRIYSYNASVVLS